MLIVVICAECCCLHRQLVNMQTVLCTYEPLRIIFINIVVTLNYCICRIHAVGNKCVVIHLRYVNIRPSYS
jgi:hypothetical protein